MLKVFGFGLLGLFVVMIFPSAITDEANPMFYGTANIVLADSDGNALMKQTVHNRITDQGETYLIRQVFDTGVAGNGDQDRVGAICIYETSDGNIVEGTVDTLANGLNVVSGNICHATLAMTNSGSISSTEGEVFTSGVDFTSGETISAILICGKNTDDNDFTSCSTPTNSVALAALIINNVTVSGSDTITITYTFNVTTATT